MKRRVLSIFLSLALPSGVFAADSDGPRVSRPNPYADSKELFPPMNPVKVAIGGAVIVLFISRFDRGIRADIFNWQNADESKDLRRIGDKAQVAGPVLGSAFLLEGLAFRNPKSVETGILSIEGFVVSGLACAGIKTLVGRKRPVRTSNSDHYDPFARDSSFPSGHTTAVFAAATVFSEQYPHWYVVGPSYAAATMVGFSRMYANKHWMSDVVAGAFLGTLTSHLIRLHRKRGHEKTAWRLEPDLDGVRLVRQF